MQIIKKMARVKVYFLALLLAMVTISNTTITEQDPKEVIKTSANAIQAGDAEMLSKNLYKTVEIEILGEENFYSQAQTVQLLKNFFEKNKPTKFTITHQGVKDLSAFAIGKLQTSGATFRVSIFLKTDEGKSYIHQLRIESNDDNNN